MATEKITSDELNSLSKQELTAMVLSMQSQLDRMNENYEKLIEQIRIADQQRFGRHTEKLDQIVGQMSFFDEADAIANDDPEPDVEELLPKKPKKKKQKGKRDEDLKDFPEVIVPHLLSDSDMDQKYGENNWRRMDQETYKRVLYKPASWTVEVHTVDVVVGTSGLHQDEFTRGDRPRDLIRNSIVTPSLASAILNAKYVNSVPLNRIEQEFNRNGFNLTRQTMANWVINLSDKYLSVMYDRLHQEMMKLHVLQCDETPTLVINDGRPTPSKSYMWVHRSGEFYKDRPIVLYEYQKTRHHKNPEAYYKDFKGILVTDGLQQYHMLEDLIPGLQSANCWAHARRDFSDALKAIGKNNEKAIKQSVAYQALTRIATFYKMEEGMKNYSPKKRLKERQRTTRPLVEEFFAWAEETLNSSTVPPKGKTAQGLKYCLNQKKYLMRFLEEGEVPIDNSASERSIRTFCIGKKNWVLINSVKGAQASAVCYSISETAKLNGLNPYYYFNHLLSELAKRLPRDKNGNIETSDVDPSTLDDLLPWSKNLPKECYKERR